MRLLLAVLAGILLVTFPLPALAVSDNVNVTINVAQVLVVEYTGDPVIMFDIGYDDLIEGSLGIMNSGDILWWANIAPWMISVERSEWQTDDGDPDFEFWLQVKYGPPDNDRWVTVLVNTHPDAPADWIFSEDLGLTTGHGVIQGVDWKVKELTWDVQPGTYWCTVYFTIEAII